MQQRAACFASRAVINIPLYANTLMCSANSSRSRPYLCFIIAGLGFYALDGEQPPCLVIRLRS
jgi:hypothetical protein